MDEPWFLIECLYGRLGSANNVDQSRKGRLYLIRGGTTAILFRLVRVKRDLPLKAGLLLGRRRRPTTFLSVRNRPAS